MIFFLFVVIGYFLFLWFILRGDACFWCGAGAGETCCTGRQR